jgi:dTMP kinase
VFITFEGIDGCGKTTQLNLLHKYLKDIGYNVLTTREPGSTPLAEKLRNVLLNMEYNISSVSEILMFEAARAELVDSVIHPAICRKQIVLSDRFYDSTIAYQGFGRQQNIDDIKLLNKITIREIIPNFTFLLDIPYSVSLERRFGSIDDRIESTGNAFYERVIAGYRSIAEEEPDRVKMIDATQSKEDIFHQIIQIVKPALPPI